MDLQLIPVAPPAQKIAAAATRSGYTPVPVRALDSHNQVIPLLLL